MRFPESYKSIGVPSLKYKEYELVPIRYKDRKDIMKWRNEQIYHLRQDKPLTEETQNIYFKNVISELFSQEKPSQLLFSFLKKEKCIGYGGLVHINWDERNAEISFIIDTLLEEKHFEEYWCLFIKFIKQLAFNELCFQKIYTCAFNVRPNLYIVLEENELKREVETKTYAKPADKQKNIIVHSTINSLSLRRVSIKDLNLTFKWANDKNIRKHSLNQEAITILEHKKWFQKRLADKDCMYYILRNQLNTAIGSIRIEKNQEDASIISYLVDPKFHRNNYGSTIIKLLEKKIVCLKRTKKTKLIGLVKSKNIASLRIFRKLNYQELESNNMHTFSKLV